MLGKWEGTHMERQRIRNQTYLFFVLFRLLYFFFLSSFLHVIYGSFLILQFSRRTTRRDLLLEVHHSTHARAFPSWEAGWSFGCVASLLRPWPSCKVKEKIQNYFFLKIRTQSAPQRILLRIIWVYSMSENSKCEKAFVKVQNSTYRKMKNTWCFAWKNWRMT